MEILLWLAPAAVVTGLAMLWAGWVGRERTAREQTPEEAERFAQAIMKPLPRPTTSRPRSRTRSTGVAVRRSEPGDETRRAS